jgi:TolA-binding protein
MSAASTPVPRSSSPSASRHTLFWPMLVFLVGSGTLAVYQVMVLEDQLDEVTQAIDHMDGKIKRAQYEKAKFFSMAKEVLRLAPKDPNAEQIVVDFKIRQLQAAQPVLMDLTTPSAPARTNAAPAQPAAVTNSGPVQPSPATNAAPEHLPGPTPTP